jgi:hypothetical protein
MQLILLWWFVSDIKKKKITHYYLYITYDDVLSNHASERYNIISTLPYKIYFIALRLSMLTMIAVFSLQTPPFLLLLRWFRTYIIIIKYHDDRVLFPRATTVVSFVGAAQGHYNLVAHFSVVDSSADVQ